MPGYYAWESGDTLNAADLMSYLMKQVIPVYEDGTARDADTDFTDSISSNGGNAVYLQDTDTLYIYTGDGGTYASGNWEAIAYADAASTDTRNAFIYSFISTI